MFGIADPLNQTMYTQKKDGEVSDKNSHHLPIPFLSSLLKRHRSKSSPLRRSSNAHRKAQRQEVEGKQDAAIQASDTTPDLSTASPHVRRITDVSQELLLLYRSLHTIYGPQQNQEQNPPDAWEFPSEDDWDWEVNSTTDNNASDPPPQETQHIPHRNGSAASTRYGLGIE